MKRTIVIFASWPPTADGTILPVPARSVKVAVDRVWQKHRIRLVSAAPPNGDGQVAEQGFCSPNGSFYIARVCSGAMDVVALGEFLGYKDPQELLDGIDQFLA